MSTQSRQLSFYHLSHHTHKTHNKHIIHNGTHDVFNSLSVAPVIFGSGDGSQRLLEILAENGVSMNQRPPQPVPQQPPTAKTVGFAEITDAVLTMQQQQQQQQASLKGESLVV